VSEGKDLIIDPDQAQESDLRRKAMKKEVNSTTLSPKPSAINPQP